MKLHITTSKRLSGNGICRDASFLERNIRTVPCGFLLCPCNHLGSNIDPGNRAGGSGLLFCGQRQRPGAASDLKDSISRLDPAQLSPLPEFFSFPKVIRVMRDHTTEPTSPSVPADFATCASVIVLVKLHLFILPSSVPES